DAKPGATIALGFREPIERRRLLESARSGEIERLLNWLPVKTGDTFYTPAHTVHAIGGGIVLCEIQQHSDVTYRLWDYGRPRELHVEEAATVADLGVHPGAVLPEAISEGHQLLVRSKHFVTESVILAAGEKHEAPSETCQLWICLEGWGSIGSEAVRRGDVWLCPEDGCPVTVKAGETMRFLRTYVPGS
ncbi:MAG: phosphoheptose isomerase, partial [Terriglobia bacterium]